VVLEVSEEFFGIPVNIVCVCVCARMHLIFIAGMNGILSLNRRRVHYAVLYTVTYKFQMWG
jgi:hypothetical protein